MRILILNSFILLIIIKYFLLINASNNFSLKFNSIIKIIILILITLIFVLLLKNYNIAIVKIYLEKILKV